MNLLGNSSKFIEQVADSLRKQDVDYTLQLFNDNQNYEHIKNNCWELFPLITPYLTFKYENSNMNLFRCCEDLINRLAEVSNPEETLLQFIDEIEECEGDTKFSTLLIPMLKVLQRIPKNRVTSVSWCLNAIEIYLNKINITEEKGNENYVLRIELLYHEVLNVYDMLMQYYSDNIKSNYDFRLVLLKHLVNLLGKPLGFLNLEMTGKKSKSCAIAEAIVGKIIDIHRDPFIFMDVSNVLAPVQFSYGIFLYLILCEKINYGHIPKVYNNAYIFFSTLPYLTELLNTDSNSVTEKGLNTIKIILQTETILSHDYLNLTINKEFCDILENILVFNENEKLRNQAFQIFQNYIDSFDTEGKYLLIFNLLPNIQHSGFASFVITKFKNILVDLQKSKSEDLHCFSERKLFSFLHQCCHISKADEYNLINITEKIMAVLNLMRFVVLQENLENRETFSKEADYWKRFYLDRLTQIIETSKRDFEEKKHEIVQGREPNQEFNLAVGGQPISEMPSGEKIKNMELALTGFQMIESLIKRLIELLVQKECYDDRCT